MRFRFCGDSDCPDWLLAEINAMTRLSSVKMKLLCQQVAKSLLGEDIDYDKVKKLTADAKFEIGDVKACIAALSFILKSSARYSVDDEALNSELQQLGLPKEHATALCKVHHELIGPLTQLLLQTSLRLSRLEGVQWRVDVITDSSRNPAAQGQTEPQIEVQLALKVNDPGNDTSTTHRMCLSPNQLDTLISELKKGIVVMDSLIE